ncbi:MAG: pilus assembly protein PilM [Candidatus Omnitrophota bacterium]|nr:pilus assembly protein PilM [Candidatus Omnitrophota bacterium]
MKKKTKRFLSIDFGLAFIKIVYLESLKGNLRLLNYDFRKILPVEESRHEIIGFLNNFLKSNSIPEKKVYLTIAGSDSVIIENLVLPAIPKTEISKAAKWELKNKISFNLDDALFDWQLAREYTDKEGVKKKEIVFILASFKIVNRYLSIVGDCGLNPVSISSGPFNYSHILKHCEKKAKIQAILDMGYNNTALSIYYNNKLIFLRKLAFSSNKLTQSLTTTLASDTGKLELSYEEAEKIKQTFGIPREEERISENYNIKPIQVISLIRPFLETLVKELKRSFNYFMSNFQLENPSILYITGGGANLKNLIEYLNKEFVGSVSKLPLSDCIDKQALTRQRQEKLDSDRNRIINALGAVLADTPAVNILPQEVKTRKIGLIQKTSLRIITIMLGVIFLFSLFSVKFQIRDYKNRLESAQVHLQTISGIKSLRQKVGLLENLLDKIKKGRVPVDGLLKVINLSVPNDIMLQELSFNHDRYSLILKGIVPIDEDIAGFALSELMENIELSSFFTEASLLSFKKTGDVQVFEIKCDLIH